MLDFSKIDRPKTIHNFMKHVHHEPMSGCWLWAGCLHPNGYGGFRLAGAKRRAHRVAYELYVGPIPKHDSYHGTCVCHTCDNKACVNPDHLFLGTQMDNLRDMYTKERNLSTRKATHLANRGTGNTKNKLSEDDALEICYRARLGQKQTEIAKEFGIGSGTISKIKTGRTWNYLTNAKEVA